MSEDLADYLQDHKTRVRYLHSDIGTVERTEIIRDLRLGVFDVLVGINLLREGLDMPEVSLVAIFDADKEGFLRSERSLIQTIGRAARHINGKAILYADKITGSMERAIDETNRRRKRQLAYNKEKNITPKTIVKKVKDVMEQAYPSPKQKYNNKIENYRKYKFLSAEKLSIEIKKIEKQMFRYAMNLEFEKAANLRDKVKCIREVSLGLE